jgi:hypothetical protein
MHFMQSDRSSRNTAYPGLFGEAKRLIRNADASSALALPRVRDLKLTDQNSDAAHWGPALVPLSQRADGHCRLLLVFSFGRSIFPGSFDKIHLDSAYRVPIDLPKICLFVYTWVYFYLIGLLL